LIIRLPKDIFEKISREDKEELFNFIAEQINKEIENYFKKQREYNKNCQKKKSADQR